MLRKLLTYCLLLITIVSTSTVLASQHHHHRNHHSDGDSANDGITEQHRMSNIKSLNVFKKPLGLHSTQPLTGFLRNGYCEVPPGDTGNHSVAAVVTKEFLEFSAARGNDLRTIGLTHGCKWCLCAGRWREAFDARKGDDDPVVPKVFLHATSEKALGPLKLDDLKKFAADPEASHAGVNPQEPSSRPGAAIREV